MSNRLFQRVINQLKETMDRTIGVVDETGTIVSCSDAYRVGEVYADAISQMIYSGNILIHEGCTFKVIGNSTPIEYVAFIEGEDSVAETYVRILSISLSNMKALYDEKYDKVSFIKNILLDNILPSDIYVKSKELHLAGDTKRVVYLIRFQGRGELTPYEMIQHIFPDRNTDYVISVGENDIVLVKEFKNGSVEYDEVESVALSIVDTVSSEFFVRVNVAIGSLIDNIRDVARSYKEAQTALEVGKVFDTDKLIINYDTLGISRLIYQLPTTLCEMFLQEVFKKGSLESLDRETLATIQKFFENNLNISETSRKLFVHRNTLVYRLEKIRKLTGLDLREFEDAITFKVALMVRKYLEAKPGKY